MIQVVSPETDLLEANKGSRIALPGKFLVLPHEKAPKLSKMAPDGASLVIQQVADEIASGNFSLDRLSELYDFTREACFVNLYFFLKAVAGHSGPYDLLNEDIHLDMCNFRQSSACMAPGARAYVFVHRGGYKSSIISHGADEWEIIRNPNIRISLRNAIFDRGCQFVQYITNTFSGNELVEALLPEFYVSNPRMQGCNESEFLCPARTRFYGEPTVKAGAASGSVEGDHVDLSNPDDLAGGDDLDIEHRANINMERKKRWFATNKDALLVSPKISRIVGAGTRWGPDDFYQPIFEDAKDIYGFRPDWFKPVETGSWTIYYRMAMENGEPSQPDLYNKEYLTRKSKEDPWYYLTQLQNSPYAVGLTEFSRLEVPMGRCFPARLCFHDGREQNDYVLLRDKSFNVEAGDPFSRLSECHVVITVDPAVTDKGILSKACRSAVEAWAIDKHGTKFYFDGRVGHFNIFQLYDAIFELANRYKDYSSCTYFERNGFQKILYPLLDHERAERIEKGTSVWIDFDGIATEGEKEARIRTILGTDLMKGRLVVCEGVYAEFQEEKVVFPQARYRMDVLDAAQMAVSALVKPPSDGEREQVDERERLWLKERSPVTGY